ncbi:hypothetical protein HPT27_06040 [Permianibacter sp. IMCC34836]|uniref:VOC family protein n=1 Tax=Permianibacter fluminis TaxID=2738515 RepID=UPI001553DDB3|nr:VOC family protein [Permianibacter fluminis]NQD36577.1 hypothetical protein [Permianibacter fluminis]
MLLYTLSVQRHSLDSPLCQHGLGLQPIEVTSDKRVYLSSNDSLMVVLVSAEPPPAKHCRGHVMYPVSSTAEVDQLYQRATAAGAVALMAPRRTALGYYSAYLNDDDGYLWEITANSRLLDCN